MGELREKCAVAAAHTSESLFATSASELVYESLRLLQHRGEEASGIASQAEAGSLDFIREHGYVPDVFTDGTELHRVPGMQAIGHNRYSTNGDPERHLQPVVDKPLGFAFAHNGNIPDTSRLEARLHAHNIHTNSINDSEMMAYAIAQVLRDGKDLPTAAADVAQDVPGAYSVTALHNELIVAMRDPYGIRPLSMASFKGNALLASETCVFDALEAENVADVEPGEIVVISGQKVERFQFAEPNPKLDIFEIVYFARPDSTMYGKRVSEMRSELGRQLAVECPPITDDASNILVVPVPDTSVFAAEGYADALGLQHGQAIIKDRYSGSGRSFIAANQTLRKQLLKVKHTFLPEKIRGRDMIVIDDSVVRGKTMPRIIQKLKALGARSVSCLVASPPVRFPDHYGIDTPRQSELIAANLTIKEIQQQWDCDHLAFLSLSGMIQAIGRDAEQFNLASFNGEYPIDIGEINTKNITVPVSMEFAD